MEGVNVCNAAPLERIRVCETHCVLNLMLDKEDVYYPLRETPTKVTLLIMPKQSQHPVTSNRLGP